MPAFIDDILNRVTMYRLVLYYLSALVAGAVVLGFLGILPQNPADLLFSTAVILAACWLTNTVFAKTFGAATNVESVYITALILALIIAPVAPANYAGVGLLIYASVWAMASKYIFALGKKHVFNPAAFGVAFAALTIGQSATWWVAGNLALLPLVVAGGLLVVRKLRRFDLVLSFAAAALAATELTSRASDHLTPVTQTLLHSSFFFLAFVMLTEPLTMPPDRIRRVVYGALVGLLFAPNVHLGSVYLTPELALLIGNMFAYLVSPKGRFMLTLTGRRQLAAGVWEFAFVPDRRFAFAPGQYLEWTLPHRNSDSRGNRRYFTVASSPTERTVSLGVKFYEPMSSFKRALMAMREGDTLSASHVAGDFVLPRRKDRKLALLAGGIGVTPFRSMAQYMLDTGDRRDAVLLYSTSTPAEAAYRGVFDRAQRELGMRTVYTGLIDGTLIAKEIPDYRERMFYISGPRGMVDAFKKTLSQMGVPRWHIKTDYFPGFA